MIHGIDLNSFSVAIASHTPDGIRLNKHVCPTKGKSSMLSHRAAILGELFAFTMTRVHPGDIVYVESPILAGARNIQSTVKVGGAYGAVLAAVELAQGTAVEVAVSSWKVATVGNGSASKDDVSRWLHSAHTSVHRECAGDQDLMDAVCISLYGLTHAERSAQISGGDLLHQAEGAQDPRHQRH